MKDIIHFKGLKRTVIVSVRKKVWVPFIHGEKIQIHSILHVTSI